MDKALQTPYKVVDCRCMGKSAVGIRLGAGVSAYVLEAPVTEIASVVRYFIWMRANAVVENVVNILGCVAVTESATILGNPPAGTALRPAPKDRVWSSG